jgi:CMP-N-acetylneuraminic acid synthetase
MNLSPIVALIPARAGSKGVPGKNWLPINGVDCVTRAIECAVKSGVIGSIVVSTDSDEVRRNVAAIARPDVYIRHRPEELARDDTPMFDVVKDALLWLRYAIGIEPSAIVLLQPTSPLRLPEQVAKAVAIYSKTNVSSVVCVSPVPTKYHRDVQRGLNYPGYRNPGYLNYGFDNVPALRQELGPRYIRNGYVYVFNPGVIDDGLLYGDESMPLTIDGPTISIDTPEDWAEAERILIEREGDRRHEEVGC